MLLVTKMVTINELIQLGYNVIGQDIDVVWKSDPRGWLLHMRNSQHLRFDVEMSYDGRTDYIGPGNVGFYVVYPSCRTKILFATLVMHIHILWHENDDQWFLNSFIGHSKFSPFIRFRTLPLDIFVNGNLFDSLDKPKKYHDNEEYGLFHKFTFNPAVSDKPIIVHACWTSR